MKLNKDQITKIVGITMFSVLFGYVYVVYFWLPTSKKIGENSKKVEAIQNDIDKAKAAKYCELAKLSEQMEQAEKKKDQKKMDELSKKADELTDQLGPQYIALVEGLDSLDQNSKDGEEIGTILEGLDKLCAKK